MIFEKKEIIYSETLGVCKVEEVTKLSQKNGQAITYYGLRSLQHREKVSYIPVENHSVKLRPLITLEEARQIKDSTYEDESEPGKFEVDYVLSKQDKISKKISNKK